MRSPSGRALHSALKKSTIRGTSREKDARGLAATFEKQAKQALEAFKKNRKAEDQVAAMVDTAGQIDPLVYQPESEPCDSATVGEAAHGAAPGGAGLQRAGAELSHAIGNVRVASLRLDCTGSRQQIPPLRPGQEFWFRAGRATVEGSGDFSYIKYCCSLPLPGVSARRRSSSFRTRLRPKMQVSNFSERRSKSAASRAYSKRLKAATME